MVVKRLKREHMVAQSGEVFYVEYKRGSQGKLKKCKSIEEYEQMVNEEEKLSNLYFEITVNGCFHKIQLVNERAINKVLNSIEDFDTQYQEKLRYLKQKEDAKL